MKTRAQKEQTVIDLSEKLSRSRSVVFTDYQGLSMKQLSDLRDKLREQNAEFIVTKNTLLEHALPVSNFQLPAANFEGPTATLFAYDDEISPLKALVQVLKDAQKGSVKMGFLGSQLLDQQSLLKLSTLPSKLELRGQVVGTLYAPLFGLANVLQGNLRNLVYALDQIRQQKGGE